MGDAAPPPQHATTTTATTETGSRDIHVLVTGFGAFRSSANNPSWLIASSLPQTLELPHLPHRVVVHTYPSAVRVAYESTAILIPEVLDQQAYDFILHIGLAAGRDSYTLETVAYRDDYVIADVDGCDGYLPGSREWKRMGVPEHLDVGWHAGDVSRRWEQDVVAGWGDGIWTTAPHGVMRELRKPVVKLSKDAGRYLCEFILMTSLAWRWLQAQRDASEKNKVGKVAFLHVPNGSSAEEVSRGVIVAEGAIRSLVSSWEEGWRNPNVYPEASEVKVGQQNTAYESQGTGDAIAS